MFFLKYIFCLLFFLLIYAVFYGSIVIIIKSITFIASLFDKKILDNESSAISDCKFSIIFVFLCIFFLAVSFTYSIYAVTDEEIVDNNVSLEETIEENNYEDVSSEETEEENISQEETSSNSLDDKLDTIIDELEEVNSNITYVLDFYLLNIALLLTIIIYLFLHFMLERRKI